MGNIIREEDKAPIQERLAGMTKPVKFVYFSQEFECMYCRETGQLLEELAELSDLITFEKHMFTDENELANKYGIDKIPGTVLLGENDTDYGVRYYGIPSGYEFSTLLDDLNMVSSGQHGLSQETLDLIGKLDQDVHLQVFITPTCPHCPKAVHLAHQLAVAHPRITADMIEAQEFPAMSQKFNVMGVPRTVINDHDFVEGGMPEKMFMDKLQGVLGL